MYKKRPGYVHDYSRLNWANEDFSGKALSSIDFSHAFAPHIDFSGATLSAIDFSGSDLTGAQFSRAVLHNVNFSGAMLRDATFAEAELRDVNFSGATLQGSDLTKATLVSNIHVDSPKQFRRLTLSFDGKLLAGVEEQHQQIWLWETALARPGKILATPAAPVRYVFFHPIIHILVSVQADQSIAFWDADRLQCMSHLELTDRPEWGATQGALFSPDGRFFAIPTRGGHLLLWECERMAVAWRLPTSRLFAFSPDSTLLATADEAISLWDLSTGQLLRQLPLSEARELTFHASGRALFVLADRLYQVEVSTSNLLDPRPAEHPGHTKPVMNAVFSPDGSLLATCDDTTVQVWEVPGGKHLLACTGRRVLFAPDGSWLAVLTSEGDIQHWDCATWSVTHTFAADSSTDVLLFSPDGRLLLCFYGKHWLQSWTLNPAEETTMEEDCYRGNLTLFASERGTRLWPDLAEQTRRHGAIPAVWRASFSPDSRWLTVLTEDDERFALKWSWDLTTGAAGPPVKLDEADRPYEHSRQSLDHQLPAGSPDGRWQVRADGHHVQIWDQEHQCLVAKTSEPPNPQTISPGWHDWRVRQELADPQETWSDLLEHTPPEHAELEQALIRHKIAFEDRQTTEHPQSLLPRGSRQDAFWHSIQELAFDPI